MSFKYADQDKVFLIISESTGLILNTIGIILTIQKKKEIKNHMINKTYSRLSLWILNFSIAGMVLSLIHNVCYLILFRLQIINSEVEYLFTGFLLVFYGSSPHIITIT